MIVPNLRKIYICLLKLKHKLHWCAKTVSAECFFFVIHQLLRTHPYSYDFSTKQIFTFSIVNSGIPKKILLFEHYIIYGSTMHNPVKMHVTHTRPRILFLKLPWRQLRRVYDMRDRPDDNFPAYEKKNSSINWLKWKYFFRQRNYLFAFQPTLSIPRCACIILVYMKWCCRPLRLRGCLELNSDEWITTECSTRSMMMSVNRRIASLVWIFYSKFNTYIKSTQKKNNTDGDTACGVNLFGTDTQCRIYGAQTTSSNSICDTLTNFKFSVIY